MYPGLTDLSGLTVLIVEDLSGTLHPILFAWFWRSNPGLCICHVSMLPTESHPSPKCSSLSNKINLSRHSYNFLWETMILMGAGGKCWPPGQQLWSLSQSWDHEWDIQKIPSSSNSAVFTYKWNHSWLSPSVPPLAVKAYTILAIKIQMRFKMHRALFWGPYQNSESTVCITPFIT